MRFIFALALLIYAAPTFAQTGIASVYWEGSHTASGERLCRSCLTAAMRKPVPLGAHVRVCKGPRCIVVKVNDRGPFVRGRIIDLTPAGALALGFSGLAHVTTEILR